ncbi:hypothetical protein Hanom_Chr08g00697411 [Helianthus anomalus]
MFLQIFLNNIWKDQHNSFNHHGKHSHENGFNIISSIYVLYMLNKVLHDLV